MSAEPIVDVERLGKAVDDALGAGPSAERRAQQRERLVEAVTARDHRVVRPWLAIATVAAAAVLLGWWWIPERGVEPAAGAGPDPVAVREPAAPSGAQETAAGTWVRAPDGETTNVVPRDGLRLTLEPGSSGRLQQRSGDHVLALEAGAVQAEVAPNQGIAFSVEAGPYEVRVVGTRFRVGWSGSARTLDVTVERGTVRVRGPGVDASEGLAVGAGMQLTADSDRREIVLRQPQPPEHAVPAQGPTATKSVKQPTPWMDLARAGRYREAMVRVSAIGFDTVARRSDRATLALLADTARLARETGRAKRALDELRVRHPNSREGRRAAFHLGRIAADADHDFPTAVRWLREYLDASPTDTFAREARGRLMDALYRTGDMGGARSVAREYLRRHPAGPHADAARSLIGS